MINRKSREGAYSIEELFHTIALELGKYVEVIEYQTGYRWSIFRDVWRLRKLNADIYHVVGDVHYFVLFLPRIKTVLTIHDINHYLNDLSGLKRWVYKWLWLKWPIRTSNAVTAISKETKDNLIGHAGPFKKHIEVIENCHSTLLKPFVRPFNISCPVILHIGTAPHKNVPRLIEALRQVNCKLVLIGQLNNLLKQNLDDWGINYVNHVNLTYKEICQHYIDCDIVSFVSLAEGFGMPVVEAQASARPLVTSNISPMKDVAGECACLVDPLDVEAIREGIMKIIKDADYREKIVEEGLRNVVRFSPVTTCAQYLNVYKSVSGVQTT